MAFKRIENKDDYATEIANLNYLRESLRRHKHITMHIAALIHGTTFYIFLPYTEYGSLEVFLSEGLDSSQGTNLQYNKYDFKEHFPSFTPRDLFQQVFFLASALQYLHSGLEITDSPEAYYAHNDFRTDNILIFPKANMPAGKWTISDFRISSFNFLYPFIRNLAERADSKLG